MTMAEGTRPVIRTLASLLFGWTSGAARLQEQ